MVFRRRKLTDRVQTVVDEVLHMLQRETQSGFQQHRPSAVQAARLEERILMSASPMAVVAEGAVQAVDASVAVMETRVDSSTGSDVVFDGIVDENIASEGINEEGYSAISSDAGNLLDPNSEAGALDR